MLIPYQVNISEGQIEAVKDAIRLKKWVVLSIPKGGIRGEHELLLTPSQVNRLDKAQSAGKQMHLRPTAKQVARNASYTGGFLASIVARLLPLIARALPTIPGLTTGLLSGGISKAISGKGLGDGLYLHKNFQLLPCTENPRRWTFPESKLQHSKPR